MTPSPVMTLRDINATEALYDDFPRFLERPLSECRVPQTPKSCINRAKLPGAHLPPQQLCPRRRHRWNSVARHEFWVISESDEEDEVEYPSEYPSRLQTQPPSMQQANSIDFVPIGVRSGSPIKRRVRFDQSVIEVQFPVSAPEPEPAVISPPPSPVIRKHKVWGMD